MSASGGEGDSVRKRRDLGPDFVKGCAIILMVYGHLNFVGVFANAQKVLVDYIYTFHMPVFLLISGYFFNPYADPRQAIMRTLRYVAAPYVIFITAYLVALHLAGRFGMPTSNRVDKIGPPELLHYIFVDPIGGYWFLHTLIIFQVAVCAGLLLAPKSIFDGFCLSALVLVLVIEGFAPDLKVYNLGFLYAGMVIALRAGSFQELRWLQR